MVDEPNEERNDRDAPQRQKVRNTPDLHGKEATAISA
jgi:hypothetical protein